MRLRRLDPCPGRNSWRADGDEALLVDDGTKGGRPRVVPIRSQQQRDTLAYLKTQVRTRNGSLANPALTLKQALTRYYVAMNFLRQNYQARVKIFGLPRMLDLLHCIKA